jgi:hypothetical protein
MLAAFSLAACNLPARHPATATLSSDQVLRTAQAIAEATRRAPMATATPTPQAPSPTRVLETPAPEATGTPTSPRITANYNARVRLGPGEEYEEIDVLLEGQAADVLGRYDNLGTGTWWLVRRIGPGLDGWVWGGAVTLSGDPSQVPYLEPPPTSTPTPKPTKPPTPTPTAEPSTPTPAP